MFTISEPRRPLPIEVLPAHVACAVRGDPTCCVVAEAFKDAYGDQLLEVHVFKHITTLMFTGGGGKRYATPPELRQALAKFDETGKWDLPPGVYRLEPLARTQTLKYRREASAKGRAKGKPWAKYKYDSTGAHKPRKIHPRIINLAAQRKAVGKKPKS